MTQKKETGKKQNTSRKSMKRHPSPEKDASNAKRSRQAPQEKDVHPQFGPPSPLLREGICKCEAHERPSSSDEAKKSSILQPCVMEREVVILDSDSADSFVESEVERDWESFPRRKMQPLRNSSRSPGNRKFTVVSSEDESDDGKPTVSRDHEAMICRRSARLVILSTKAEANDAQILNRSKMDSSSKKSKLADYPDTKAQPAEDVAGDSSEGLPGKVPKRTVKRICKVRESGKHQHQLPSEPELKVPDSLGSVSPARVEDTPGDNNDAAKRVKETLRLFNSYYLRFVQEEEGRCKTEAMENVKSRKKITSNGNDERRKSRRPDLKAIQQMKRENKFLHKEKVLGKVLGVNVGDQFFSRCELMVIGLHGHWLAGIDYVGGIYRRKMPKCTLPIASSIVLSGLYEDDVDNSEDVVYTGQGGNDLLGNKRQIADQIMERGNLALKNSMEQDLPVRVIRGHKTKKSYTGKVYTYDGLYKVKEFWAEKGISGFTVFKFRLCRMEGQSVLTTEQVHFCSGQVPTSSAELRGVVSHDISNGVEKVPVPASNVVDHPACEPPSFQYMIHKEIQNGVSKPVCAKGCDCEGECVDVTKCSCAILNGKKFPYVSKNGGRLVEPMDVVYECGPQCGCGPNCWNRVSQRGLIYRLEVFKTANKGWGVRSWDTIPAGAPVCEYTGLLMRTEDADDINENDYIFELDCLQTIQGIGARQRRLLSKVKDGDITDEDGDRVIAEQPDYCINAGSCGNVSRFINHSCEPNLFVQCVLDTHHDLSQPRIILFASDNIHPLQELTYDYGYELDSVVINGEVKRLPCYCGAHGCRKRLY